MTFMIGATIQHYLTSASTPTSNTKRIIDLYTRWRQHVENADGNGDPHLASLASTDHAANTFLSAFTRHQKTLLFAARVVRDMQRPLPPTALPGITQIKPTVQTWSIFLLGFTRHKQMELAEQVLTYMRKQGIEPNQVTWNTLTAGYAGVQDVEGTVETLRRAERAGMVWDLWTHRGLRYLRERERLEVELRRRRVSETLDFSSELKEGLGERIGEQQSGEVVEGFGDSAGEIAEQGVENGDGAAYRPF
jgi:pentatricopeptide repeat protein